MVLPVGILAPLAILGLLALCRILFGCFRQGLRARCDFDPFASEGKEG